MCKPDKGRRILKGMLLAVKWLWVALLTVTLAAGIIFRVHWKADALVIILIATAVIIPRSFRKYVCLGFAVVLAALAVWVFLPESGEGWMPYLYEDEIAALKAGLCAPDEANAATIYDRLSAGYDFEAAYLVLDCLPDSPSDEPYSFLRFQAMSHNADVDQTIADLIEAGRIENCRFELSWSPFAFENRIHRNVAMRMWSWLLNTHAEQDVKAGRIDQAILKHATVLRMAGHLCRQAGPIDCHYATALESTVFALVNNMVMNAALDADQLAQVDNMLSSPAWNWHTDLPRVIDYDKLYAKHIACAVYQRNAKAAIRRIRPHRHMAAAAAAAGETISRTPLDKAAAIVLWLIWSRPEEISRIADKYYAHCYDMAAPDFPWPAKPPPFRINLSSWVTVVLKPTEIIYFSLHQAYQRTQIARLGGRVLVALQRYRLAGNDYPETLDPILKSDDDLLADAVVQGFVYRRDGDGFTLYHTGLNGADDGGLSDRETGADDLAIWPPAR
ncbi:MAG TPA: hypothetical protein P5279_09675 [Anaerohalosphaeraceae bacterium]|nr:hypothetical protein [Anaerohalosphaeraceae bacterium]